MNRIHTQSLCRHISLLFLFFSSYANLNAQNIIPPYDCLSDPNAYPSKTTAVKFIGSADTSTFVLRKWKPLTLQTKGSSFVLTEYGSNLQLSREQPLTQIDGISQTHVFDALLIEDEIVVFSGQINSGYETVSLCVSKYGTDSLNLIEPPRVIHSRNLSKQRSLKGYEYAIGDTVEGEITIVGVPKFSMEDETLIDVLTLRSDDFTLDKKEVRIPSEEGITELLINEVLLENGHITVAFETYSRKAKDDNDTRNAILFRHDFDTGKETIVHLEAEDYYINGFRIETIDDDRVGCAGLFTQKIVGGSMGTAWFEVDLSTGRVENAVVHRFQDSIIKKKERNRFSNSGEIYIDALDLTELMKYDNGDFLLVAEQDGYPAPGSTLFQSWDIVLVRFNPKGEIVKEYRISKSQSMHSTSDFLSHRLTIIDEDIFVFYNANEAFLKRKYNTKKASIEGMFPAVIHVNKDYELERYLLISEDRLSSEDFKEMAILMVPRAIHFADDRAFVFLEKGRKSRESKLFELRFKH